MTDQQPEALRLAEWLDRLDVRTPDRIQNCISAAAELRRLHEVNQQLLEAMNDIVYCLESARIWGGMEWEYNPLHPFKYLPIRDKARAAITKATENKHD